MMLPSAKDVILRINDVAPSVQMASKSFTDSKEEKNIKEKVLCV